MKLDSKRTAMGDLKCVALREGFSEHTVPSASGSIASSREPYMAEDMLLLRD